MGNGPGLNITRWHDSLGRLEDIRIENLPEQTLGRVPQPLIEQTRHRQYYYDALSQLTSIEMSERTLNFGYDGAGRLRAQEELIKGQETKRQRWEIDPAGNRLPVELTDEKQQQQDWAQMVYQNWKDPSFNLLRNGNSTLDSGQVQQWPDNRIGYLEELAWRYDEQGNRVEQLSLKQDSEGQYPRLRFGYDGANRLTTVEIARVVGRGHVAAASKEHYVYDALGRRLKKTHTDEQGKESVTYFGWDGDRLVHTETPREDGDRDIVHVVYEPGTFTPLVRLCTTAKGKQPVKPHLVIEAGLAGLPPDRRRDGAVSAPKLQEMLTSMPGQVQKEMEESMRQVLKEGLTPLSRSILTGMGMDPEELLANTRQGLQEAKQAEQTPVTIHYFHCDHLGAPLALTDQQANIVWAVKRDPWGNIEEEYNPQGLEQPIGLPGQHLDKETGLYYNRYRYYDPKVGAYINQDPIGLLGGFNKSMYADASPLHFIDSTGLDDGIGGFSVFGEAFCPGGSCAFNNAPPEAAMPVTLQKGIDFVTNYVKSIWTRITEGIQFGPTAGGSAACFLGVSSWAGTTSDTSGLTCVTSSVCGMAGPLFGATTNYAGYSVSTGKVVPGSTIWTFGGVGSFTLGAGGKGELSIGSDGSLQVAGSAQLGEMAGGGLQICRQITTSNCKNLLK